MTRLTLLSSLAFLFLAPALSASCQSTSADDAGAGEGNAETGGKAAAGGALTKAGGASSGGKGSGGMPLGGRGSGGEGGEGSDWLGREPHLEASGFVGEKEVALRATGTDAADLGTLYCERNYIVPSLEDSSDWASEGFLEKVEFKFNFFFEDSLAEFQLELATDDLFGRVGDTLRVGEDADAEVALGLKTDVDGPNETEYEDVGVSGEVYLGLLSGELEPNGLTVASGEGQYGAFVDVVLESGGTFRGSFSMNCGDNDLETPE